MSYEDLKRSMNWDSKAHKQDTRPLTTWSRLFGQLCRIPNSLILTLPAGKKGCFVIQFSHDGRSVALDMPCVCISLTTSWSVCQSHHHTVCLSVSCVSVSSPHSQSVSIVCVSLITSRSVCQFHVCQSHHLMVCLSVSSPLGLSVSFMCVSLITSWSVCQFCVCQSHHLMICLFHVCLSYLIVCLSDVCVSLITSWSVSFVCVSLITSWSVSFVSVSSPHDLSVSCVSVSSHGLSVGLCMCQSHHRMLCLLVPVCFSHVIS